MCYIRRLPIFYPLVHRPSPSPWPRSHSCAKYALDFEPSLNLALGLPRAHFNHPLLDYQPGGHGKFSNVPNKKVLGFSLGVRD